MSSLLDFTNSQSVLNELTNSTTYVDPLTLAPKHLIISKDISNNVKLLLNELTTYGKQLINHGNLKIIKNDLDDKKNEIELNNYNVENSTTTNDRKSFYEAQEYDNLLVWNLRFKIIYYIMVIMISAILIIYDQSLTYFFKGIIILLLVFYPFIISFILIPFVWIYNTVYNFFPKNVYNSL
jgi:hypothetical protein